MAYIQGTDRQQQSLLPPSIEEYVAKDSMVRVIDAFVDGLDLADMGFIRHQPKATGRPAYDPRDLLKLYIYGYTNRIRSSRRLATECVRNIEVMFLLGALTPDFRTIADFRKDNILAIKNTFASFVRICAALGLMDSGMLAIDGTKIRAQNARAHAYNVETLEKKLANIEEHITRYLKMLDDHDDDDDDNNSGAGVDEHAVRAAIASLEKRKQTYEGFKAHLKTSGDTQILTTDPDAHRMHTKDGFNCCYNVQTAVEATSHIIAGFTTTKSPTDQGCLLATAREARRVAGIHVTEVVADKGYESARDILSCLQNGIAAHVALKYNSKGRVFNWDFRPADITDELRSSTRQEDILTCLHAGTLPKCLENTGVSIEVQSRDTLSCFTRRPDNTVTCPQGKSLLLRKVRKNKASGEVYSSRDDCRECQNRCTDSPNAKEVAFSPDTDCIPVLVYGSLISPPQAIPDGARISPNNHNLDRKDHTQHKVVIKIPDDKDKLMTRMCTVEHPFGTIKWYDGAHYFLLRGKHKIEAEVALSFLAYNLRRALNTVGFERLVAACAKGTFQCCPCTSHC